ncbi:LysR family transcriptional regulator [Raoultella terrigena]|jgi:LysR family transcriptional regulator, regulator for bpeEF and oprC|uniref:LysR family transcriptional regulator n=1 Tax=Raoultella terrigena TaxID=577 RepID=UPI00349FA7CD
MDTIDLFRIFIRVAENGSFIRTAETLNRPASTISAAIRELESRLGTRLLHRTTRSVSLTSDGSALYARCLVVVQDVEETENLFRQQSGQVKGRVKVDVPGRVGSRIVIPALPDFFARHPSIQVDLGITDRSVNLPEEGVDCAVRVGALNDSGMVARRVGELKLINVASEGYISSFGSPVSPERLAGHIAVGYVSPTSGRQARWEWVLEGEIFSADVSSHLTVNSAEAYIAACVSGMGMIQIPEYDVREWLDAGILCEVMPAWLAQPLPVSIVYPSRRHLSRPLQLFIAWLEPLLREKMRLSAGA